MNIILMLIWLLFAGVVTGVDDVTSSEAVTYSHIEKVTKEPTHPGGSEVPNTGTIPEGTTTMTGKPSSQSSLPKDLTSSDPQLGKKIKILYILSLSLLLLTWLL